MQYCCTKANSYILVYISFHVAPLDDDILSTRLAHPLLYVETIYILALVIIH